MIRRSLLADFDIKYHPQNTETILLIFASNDNFTRSYNGKTIIISAFYPVADLGVNMVTNIIGYGKLITDGGTKN